LDVFSARRHARDIAAGFKVERRCRVNDTSFEGCLTSRILEMGKHFPDHFSVGAVF
jgi:hypothetical protein